MRVLTIDTATTIASVGVVLDETVFAADPIREPAAAQHVLGAVAAALARAEIELGELDAIVVGRGPGSFTGLRVGIATAIGLAAPHRLRVIGVATGAALRQAAGETGVAVIDARRGEVFVDGLGHAPRACTPAVLQPELPTGAQLVGDGAIRYRELFAGHRIPADDDPAHVPAPAALAALALAGDPATPLYVRPPDAIPAAER